MLIKQDMILATHTVFFGEVRQLVRPILSEWRHQAISKWYKEINNGPGLEEFLNPDQSLNKSLGEREIASRSPNPC